MFLSDVQPCPIFVASPDDAVKFCVLESWPGIEFNFSSCGKYSPQKEVCMLFARGKLYFLYIFINLQ